MDEYELFILTPGLAGACTTSALGITHARAEIRCIPGQGILQARIWGDEGRGREKMKEVLGTTVLTRAQAQARAALSHTQTLQQSQASQKKRADTGTTHKFKRMQLAV